jgi:putative addiction module killer protein
MAEYAIKECLRAGSSPFADWFSGLDPKAAGKVTTVLYRLEQGNLSNVKSVGGGLFECKIDFRPGYRIYFGQDGKTLIVLLGGGTKKTQQKDIDRAKDFWREYQSGKKSGG